MDSKLAQIVTAAVQELMDKNQFELRSDQWFELKLPFKFEMDGKKVSNLTMGDFKILKTPKKRKCRK